MGFGGLTTGTARPPRGEGLRVRAPVEFPLFSCQLRVHGLDFPHTLWHAQNQNERGLNLPLSKT